MIINIEVLEHEDGTMITNAGDEDILFYHIPTGKIKPRDFLVVKAKHKVVLEYRIKNDFFIRIK